MARTIEQIKSDAEWLKAKLANREMKYLRNLNRFLSNGQRREGIRQVYTTPMAFFNAQTDDDTGLLPAINVGRSMALTLQSKLIQTKGRIFFSPVNGLWETIKVVRNAQIYFDAFVDRDDVQSKIKQCVLDALIFDMGVLWIDDETKSTRRVRPWEFYVDPAEINYGKPSRALLRFDEYPLIALRDKIKEGTLAFDLISGELTVKGTLQIYFDLIEQKKYTFINSELIDEQEIHYTELPFAMYYYNEPIKGLYSNSVMDNSYQNQRQIDSILRRVHDALELSPANTIYIPKSANNQSVAKVMSNRVGNVIEYDASLGQIVVSTPPAIDNQYVSMVEFFKREAFEQEGVSQLSAQSKKPTGINAGVALDTLQDIESERFQSQVDGLIQFQRDIYTKMIKCFPKEDDILPKRINRANIKWSKIVDQYEMFSMSSSMASVLSKDPKVKMEQIEKLQAQGIINPAMASSLLQLPDLEGAYSVATAAYDDCRRIIERAVDDERYDFYSVVNLQMLLTEVVNTLLQLDAVDEDPRVLERLVKLMDIVVAKINEKNNIQNPPAPPMPAPPVVPPMGPVDAVGNPLPLDANGAPIPPAPLDANGVPLPAGPLVNPAPMPVATPAPIM
jgi:hypothetical protein